MGESVRHTKDWWLILFLVSELGVGIYRSSSKIPVLNYDNLNESTQANNKAGALTE